MHQLVCKIIHEAKNKSQLTFCMIKESTFCFNPRRHAKTGHTPANECDLYEKSRLGFVMLIVTVSI